MNEKDKVAEYLARMFGIIILGVIVGAPCLSEL